MSQTPLSSSTRKHDFETKLRETPDLETRVNYISNFLPGRTAFATSLGLEDQAVLHAISVSGAKIDIFTLDTGRHFPETLDTLEISERRYGVRIRVITPDHHDIEQFIAREGINGFRLSVQARKACCHARKVKPLARALQGAAAWITGLRRGQSDDRQTLPFADFDDALQIAKFNPLADWDIDRLERYVRENDIPVHPLHAQGFPSIGCQPCTRSIAPGEDIRAGRWWWENAEGKECGLHNRPRSYTAGTETST